MKQVRAKRRWTDLGMTLKRLRNGKGLSLKEVATESRAYGRADSLSRAESGARRPGRPQLLRILTLSLGVTRVRDLNEILRLGHYAPIDQADLEKDPLCSSILDDGTSGARSTSRSGQYEQLLIQDSKRELLSLYYPDDELQECGLSRFSFVLNGKRISTNIVTKNTWLGLGIAIGERDADRFSLAERSFSWPPTSMVEEKKLRCELEKKRITFHNKPIYCLQELSLRKKRLGEFSLSQYIDYKLRLGRLEEETTEVLHKSGNRPSVAFHVHRTRMKLRNELLPDCRTVGSFDRLCPGGTNVLLAFRKPDADGFVFFVKRRSRAVSTGRQLFSLLPSGMHQPTNAANAPFETSIAATVYRETYEELFGGEEVEAEDPHIAPLWYMSKSPLRWITEHRDQVCTEIVSFGLNLVDGTYEFGALCVINDEGYWRTFQDTMKPNSEFADFDTPLFSTLDSDRLGELLSNPHAADTSLIAVVEGLRRLKQLHPKRVKLPRIKVLMDR